MGGFWGIWGDKNSQTTLPNSVIPAKRSAAQRVPGPGNTNGELSREPIRIEILGPGTRAEGGAWPG